MTSSDRSAGREEALATYKATKAPQDVTAQATSGPALQWVLMKDVDQASGYQTPSPPEQAPEYEGQVVVVPAVVA